MLTGPGHSQHEPQTAVPSPLQGETGQWTRKDMAEEPASLSQAWYPAAAGRREVAKTHLWSDYACRIHLSVNEEGLVSNTPAANHFITSYYSGTSYIYLGETIHIFEEKS
ncbi:unnamed protein product [Caretta caretta]